MLPPSSVLPVVPAFSVARTNGGGTLQATLLVMVTLVLVQLTMGQVTAIKAGRLIDPDSGTVLTNQVIIINDGRVQAVGASLEIPANAAVIDLQDKMVLPGLIDCHTHVADGHGDGDPFNVLRKTASQIALA